MSDTEHELFQIARQLRYDLTAMQAKVSELLRALATLDLPDTTRLACTTCGLTFRSTAKLEEHTHLAHNGPVPAAWAAAEAQAETTA